LRVDSNCRIGVGVCPSVRVRVVVCVACSVCVNVRVCVLFQVYGVRIEIFTEITKKELI
jgi:hypothetical protein